MAELKYHEVQRLADNEEFRNRVTAAALRHATQVATLTATPTAEQSARAPLARRTLTGGDAIKSWLPWAVASVAPGSFVDVNGAVVPLAMSEANFGALVKATWDAGAGAGTPVIGGA